MCVCVTFQEKRHERNLGRFHPLEGFPVGFVVQRGILKTQLEKWKRIECKLFCPKALHQFAHLFTLTVMSSSSEKSFLNFPGHFWETGAGWGSFSCFFNLWINSLNTHTHTLTSQVWLSRLTAAVLRPMMIANAEFKFLWALQLQTRRFEWRTRCKEFLLCYVLCVVLLSSDLDELFEELHSLVERYTHENLGHDPLLDLVAALQEDRQRHRVARAGRTAECVVHQFLLHAEKENNDSHFQALSEPTTSFSRFEGFFLEYIKSMKQKYTTVYWCVPHGWIWRASSPGVWEQLPRPRCWYLRVVQASCLAQHCLLKEAGNTTDEVAF